MTVHDARKQTFALPLDAPDLREAVAVFEFTTTALRALNLAVVAPYHGAHARKALLPNRDHIAPRHA